MVPILQYAFVNLLSVPDEIRLIQQGIDAIKAKDYQRGRKILAQALKLNAENTTSWLWFARAQQDPERRKQALLRLLQIDPNHVEARKMMQQAKSSSASSSPSNILVSQAAQKSSINRRDKKLFETSTALLYRLVAPIWAILFLPLGPALFMVLYNEYQLMGEAAQMEPISSILMMLFLAGIVFSAFVWMFIISIRVIRRKVEIFNNGIRISDVSEDILDWNNVVAIRFVNKRRVPLLSRLTPLIFLSRSHLTMQLNNGKKVVLDQTLKDYHSLFNILMKVTAPVWAERDKKRIQLGETVSFGKITVDREGFHEGKKAIKWPDVTEFKDVGIFGRVTIVGANGVQLRQKQQDTWNVHVIPYLVASGQS